ncbi:MAG: CPBP family intramembrane metalloprotease [Anaerolineae bacterium]|nr:CPBP family intramembrane metalloprotease [Anaerolineae bacterium]
MNANQPRFDWKVIAFIVFLYALWFVRSPVLAAFESALPPLAYELSVPLTKILCWIVPVWLYLRFVDNVPSTTALKLDHNVRRGVAWGFAIPAAHLVIVLLLHYVARLDLIHVTLAVDVWTWISVIGLAGLTEEIVFRGFILPKLMTRWSFWIANAVTTVLFVVMHIPYWARLHYTPTPLALAMLVGFSLLWGWSYKRSGSLWSAILAHTLYDLISVLLLIG